MPTAVGGPWHPWLKWVAICPYGGHRREADPQDPIVAILAIGDEMEDTEWRNISDTSSTAMGALCDATAPACQVRRVSVSNSHLPHGHS
jgi:hypothetical protein